ncbi:hypothetical protein NHH31_16945, partial [Escherichia albertii]|uniref:hypothetical protein n=1 Tax=Escherichia albertii TaxID=208962 RepID=UPI00211A59C7
LFDTCSCQTARCFNKSKGVLITGSKLKAFQNPQPSWGFSVHKKAGEIPRLQFVDKVRFVYAGCGVNALSSHKITQIQ